jgi:asparagine synthase (glutamine-hydrolysing)
MCGISGFMGSTSDPDARARAERMIAAISHRGPDATGVHLDGGIVLAHARLSIVDLSGGAQPMRDATEDFVISFNGEIFNHVELRAALEARGARFPPGRTPRSSSSSTRPRARPAWTISSAISPSRSGTAAASA